MQYGVRLPIVPNGVEQSYHLFYILMPDPRLRHDLIAHLKSKGILAVFHYLPLHSSPMGISLGVQEAHCPVSVSVSERLLRLPFYTDLSQEDQSAVIAAILDFTGKSQPTHRF
jgi:dTDP-4-amino-4,6-dideoxygalactose transaminase